MKRFCLPAAVLILGSCSGKLEKEQSEKRLQALEAEILTNAYGWVGVFEALEEEDLEMAKNLTLVALIDHKSKPDLFEVLGGGPKFHHSGTFKKIRRILDERGLETFDDLKYELPANEVEGQERKVVLPRIR